MVNNNKMMQLSQQPWPPPQGEASASGAATDDDPGPRNKNNLSRVEAAPHESSREAEAAPLESPEGLQRLVEQLSDENLQLRRQLYESARKISDLEAQVLRLHGRGAWLDDVV